LEQLYIYRRVAKMAYKVPNIPFTWFPLILTFYIIMAYLSKTKKLSAIKKEIIFFAGKWMKLEIILSK
jgi:hypothetical protein